MDFDKSSCSKCAATKKDNHLTLQQEIVYGDISKFLKETSNGVIVIDTLSGTGKTFLLSTLAQNSSKPVKFIIFRKDQASRISLNGIDTYTYVSFIMHYFYLSYKKALHMFGMNNSNDNVAELYKLIVYAKKFVDNESKIIVLDIFTVPPPTMLILLYIVSLKNELHLIFAGSCIQLETINKSPLHDESNFFIIEILNDLMINNQLSQSMRICDSELADKMKRFSQVLKEYKTTGNVPFHYNIRYELYRLFQSKYFTEERFDTVYIAPTHKMITKRICNFIYYLESKGIKYVESPFYYVDQGNVKTPIHKNCKGKFFPSLLLVEGYKYIHINEKGVNSVVKLEKIIYENYEACSLTIRFMTKNKVDNIKRQKLNYYQILPAYRTWLLNNIVHTDELWQFPLRHYTLTYHAALGRTIHQEKVELNTDCSQANFIYVGLSCVRHYSDIHKIHDVRDLPGYVVTDYMENVRNDKKYYYRCPSAEMNKDKIFEYISNKGPNEYIDSIDWKDVTDVKQFEKMPLFYLRIERSLYKQSNVIIDTPLMKIARFIKENPTVIRNTIKMAPVEDFSGYGGDKNIVYVKTKKKTSKTKKEVKRSSAFDYLTAEYNQWLREREKVEM